MGASGVRGPTVDERRGLKDHGFPSTYNTPVLRAVPRLPPAGCVSLGMGLYLPLCALVSYLYSGHDSKSVYYWWLRGLRRRIHVNEIAALGTE